MQTRVGNVLRQVRPPVRVGGLIALIAVVDVLLLIPLWGADAAIGGVELHVAGLTALFAAVEWRVIHIQFRSEASSFSLLEVPLVLGILYAPPQQLIPAAAIGVAVGLTLGRRQSILKVAFNVANVVLYAIVASWIVQTMVVDGDLGRVAWLSAFLATAVGSGVNVTTIMAAIALTEGAPSAKKFTELIVFGLAIGGANTAVGLAAALLLPIDGLSLVFLVAPGALVLGAFRRFASERAQRERVEFLYRSTRGLAGGGSDDTLIALLDEACEMFRAEIGAAILLDGDDSASGRVVLSSQEKGRDTNVKVDVALARQAVTDLGEATFVDARSGDALARIVEQIGGDDAMVAKLATDERDLGLLVIANRRGEVTAFGPEDVQVLGALARHSAVLLHSDQLEHALHELRKLERRLAHQATHDPLTGLPNRSLFRTRLDDALAGSDSFAVLFIDLDDFKVINDTSGHHEGDQVLIEVGSRIQALVRPVDTAARVGGDEFAVLLQNHAQPQAVADRIVSSVAKPIDVGGASFSVGCSIGITTASPGLDAGQALRQADLAMYEAKQAGKNLVVVYDPKRPAAVRQPKLPTPGRDAISPDALELRYQPIFDLSTRTVVGAEALVRWRSPDRGLVLPGEFISEAERDGSIIPIDRWVLQRALADVDPLLSGDRDFFLSVNIAARHLQAPDLAAFLESHQPSPDGFSGQLVVEVSETALIGELDQSRSSVADVRATGVRVGLDDFGTGYSSLSYLREFEIDLLKVAVQALGPVETGRDRALLRAVVDLGQALELPVVAEGVESIAQIDALTDVGCDMAQGFHLARPMSIDALLLLTSDRPSDPRERRAPLRLS